MTLLTSECVGDVQAEILTGFAGVVGRAPAGPSPLEARVRSRVLNAGCRLLCEIP